MTGASAGETVDLRELDGASLEPALVENRAALVEFWADWCLFSRLLLPKSRWLAACYGTRLLVARCRLDARDPAVERFGIRYLPAVLLFEVGRPRRRWYGDTPARLLARAIESLPGNGHG